MEFLVRLEVRLPPETDPLRRAELEAAEGARGVELIEAGHLKRIWRVPGRRANLSLYDVDDASHLHRLLCSLPMWPWIDASVEPLAAHPLEQP